MSHAEQADPPASAGNPAINVSSAAPPSSTSSESAPDPKGSVVKRAMDATAEKLARGKSLLSQSQPSLPQESSHRRMFSLTRGKGKEKLGDEGRPQTSQSQVFGPPPSSPSRLPGRNGEEDSPFITPQSPSLLPSRPESILFRGFRSVHAGTQTFIQALQAVPWAEDQDNDDEYMSHDVTPGDLESDEDDKTGNRLTSSIHAIYRPLARFKRGEASGSNNRAARSPDLPSVSDSEEAPQPDSSVVSDEETEGDFETGTGEPITAPSHSGRDSPETIPDLESSIPSVSTATRRRGRAASQSGSITTVRYDRRAQLAEKLRGVFELDNINEVVAEMPCWLLRSVLLQGYMYLTDAYICFFAHLPSREDQILKSGSLFKKAQRTKRWIRHWFILKNDVLSWYQSASDPYFPHGVVDLRYAISCEAVNEKDIRLRTHQKSIRLSADSVPSRDEWIKAIRRVMLKAQNMGDTIKIAIPYPTVVDVDRSNAMDFSETIEIKVQDKNTDLALDSYFFAYFQDLPKALEQIRDAVRTYRGLPSSCPPTVVDSTAGRSSSPRTDDRPPQPPSTETSPRSATGFRLPSLLRPLQETLPISRTISAPAARDGNEEFTHIVKRSGSSFVPVATSLETSSPTEGELPGRPSPLHSSSSSLTPAPTPTTSSIHTYPPSTTASNADIRNVASPSAHPSGGSGWSVGLPSIPSWLRVPSRTSLFGAPATGVRPNIEHAATMPAVTEVVSSRTSSSNSRDAGSASVSGEFGFFSILETPETTVDPETADKFRQAFAFDDKENVLGIFTGHLFRLLPVYGRLYVSNNYFCFKSSGPLTAKTRMILPLKDILSTEKQKSFRFGHQGLVIIVKGHEELFFEFDTEERRDAFISVIHRQLEDVRKRTGSSDMRNSPSGKHEALILEEFGPRNPLNMTESQNSSSDSAPPFMFTSQSSTFLSFKPKQSLHFTFLTIGSRGDVQPYIALAKGLMADGHRVRIATHGEFEDWVKSHGIEFGYVGGDPAELMRICVENGTFTVAFLREGVQKFRGWIDDLLKTSWEACQGTDVLIESPSAMGGYHIAEALKIPYFRAFTMTWSRTRAYPHAFAVPEHKMGGNYNYMTYVLFDQVFWRGTSGQINRWRRNTLGLHGTSLDKMEPHKIPFLYNFSPIVVPPPLDWPEWIRVTGYWFLDDADVSSKKWEPPQDLLDFMADARKANKKVVYIGFGSIVVPDPKAMTRCVIDAIVQSGVYAIMSKGWSDRLVKNQPASTEPEEPLPKQIYPISSIPHDWLFKQIDAACHHGGAGTTGASLRAGIPTIIKPFFGDQFFWADRVEALGIGAAVRKLTVETLAEALREATTNPKLIERAKLVGEQIRAENGVATAIEAIYRDLEYARTLVKGAGHRDTQPELIDAEHATIRDYPCSTPPEHPSPNLSASGWSVISDNDEPSQEPPLSL